MKTIGLLGGMSWESSLEYYRIINEETHARLGGHHNAPSVMVTVNFHDIEARQHQGDWDGLTQIMIDAARQVERGGGECLVICTNTMHLMADAVQAAIDIPLLHIADATAAAIKRDGLTKVGLLGTRFTMERDFYKGRLVEQHGLDVIIPDEAARQTVHDIIYNELVFGDIRADSRNRYRDIITQMAEAGGAQGVILGCTEIGLLIKPQDSPIPVFDTTQLHALAAVDWALA
ncbi:MAG: aspartate/glutamate racemase family protein [Chloroflexi bacterium]|nr:MAG: aspartate/glutamate racemase family protein [Chloroflexota bacterium]